MSAPSKTGLSVVADRVVKIKDAHGFANSKGGAAPTAAPSEKPGPIVCPTTGTRAGPAYARIVETLTRRLCTGHYRPGSRLPSEAEFCAEFRVSHMTLRRAMAILAERGLVSTERGRGTFARSCDLSDAVFSMKQLAGEWCDRPLEARLLSLAMMKASGWIARRLAIAEGDHVIHLRQLMLSAGVPVVYHWEYIRYDPRRPYVELVLEAASLHGLLKPSKRRSFGSAQVTLRATALSATAARLLSRPPRTPALRIQHLFHDGNGHPVSSGCLLMRADVFTLQTSLGPGRFGDPAASRPTRPAPPSCAIQLSSEV
ncbi:MAG: GntR family transcriptional regulator [Thermoleophilia bacterium]|nr:GntR family transcriptional regulator [Thermoleophilia bacterium]